MVDLILNMTIFYLPVTLIVLDVAYHAITAYAVQSAVKQGQ